MVSQLIFLTYEVSSLIPNFIEKETVPCPKPQRPTASAGRAGVLAQAVWLQGPSLWPSSYQKLSQYLSMTDLQGMGSEVPSDIKIFVIYVYMHIHVCVWSPAGTIRYIWKGISRFTFSF